jgi:hypothetical protein
MSYYDSDAWRTSRGMPAGARIDGVCARPMQRVYSYMAGASH